MKPSRIQEQEESRLTPQAMRKSHKPILNAVRDYACVYGEYVSELSVRIGDVTGESRRVNGEAGPIYSAT